MEWYGVNFFCDDHAVFTLFDLATELGPYMQKIIGLEDNSLRGTMTSLEQKAVLQMFEGRLVLAKPPHLNGTLCRARAYTAMDEGRAILADGWRSGFLVHYDMDDDLYGYVMSRQRKGGSDNEVSHVDSYFYVDTAASFAELRRLLQTSCCPLLPVSAADVQVSWATLFVFLCEMKQVINNRHLGMECLREVLDTPKIIWAGAASLELERLLEAGAVGKCHMVQVLGIALRACREQCLKRPLEVEQDNDVELQSPIFMEECLKPPIEVEPDSDVELQSSIFIEQCLKRPLEDLQDCIAELQSPLFMEDCIPWRDRVRSHKKKARGDPTTILAAARARQRALRQNNTGTVG